MRQSAANVQLTGMRNSGLLKLFIAQNMKISQYLTISNFDIFLTASVETYTRNSYKFDSLTDSAVKFIRARYCN